MGPRAQGESRALGRVVGGTRLTVDGRCVVEGRRAA